MDIKLLLVDDQNLIRMGIASLLGLTGKVEVVAQLDNGLNVIESIKTFKPDVMLLDIKMPKMSGIEVLALMNEKNISLPTIMLTAFEEHHLVLESIRLGAKGYIRKDVSLELLLTAVEKVNAGEVFVQPVVTSQISEEKTAQNENKQDGLSSNEIQVLRLIAAGYSNNEISEIMFKSAGTIRNKVSFILAKLQVRDRTRAVIKAIELGVI